jgi:glyoxylate/succinic semialdehyde reductase
MKYGFLGLGIMGTAMAANLVKAGLDVTVWNRDAKKCEPLVELGAHTAGTPREVVEKADLVFAMLADPAASESVILGPGGVLDGMAEGKGFIDMTTNDPETGIDMSRAIIDQGGRYLEAPVSGSKGPAEAGDLIIMAAGDRELFDLAEPAFTIMGKMHIFVGELGQAARMKLVVNMIMGGMMTAFSEGLNLGKACELDLEQLQQVLANGALANPMFSLKGPAMVEGKYPTAFPLKHMEKDLRLALFVSCQQTQIAPTAEAAQELFAQAKVLGFGDEDFSAVHKVIGG